VANERREKDGAKKLGFVKIGCGGSVTHVNLVGIVLQF